MNNEVGQLISKSSMLRYCEFQDDLRYHREYPWFLVAFGVDSLRLHEAVCLDLEARTPEIRQVELSGDFATQLHTELQAQQGRGDLLLISAFALEAKEEEVAQMLIANRDSIERHRLRVSILLNKAQYRACQQIAMDFLEFCTFQMLLEDQRAVVERDLSGELNLTGGEANLEEAQNALDLALRSNAGPRELCLRYLNVGRAASELGKRSVAVQALAACERLAININHPAYLGQSRLWLGYNYRRYDLQQANDYYQAALQDFEAANMDEYHATALRRLADVKLMMGDEAKAEALLAQGLAISDRLHNDYLRGMLLYSKGTLLFNQGNIIEGEHLLEKAIQLLRDQEFDARGLLGALIGLANIKVEHGKLQAAQELYEEALALTKQKWFEDAMARLLVDMGVLYSLKGEFSNAARYLDKAQLAADEQQDVMTQLMVLNAQAIMYYDVGHLDESISYLEQGLALMQSTQQKSHQRIFEANLALAYAEKNDYVNARTYAQRVIADAMPLEQVFYGTVVLDVLAMIEVNKGDYADGLALFERSLKIHEQRQTSDQLADTLTRRGNAYLRMGEPQKAMEDYQHALRISKKLNYLRGQARQRLGIAKVLYRSGNESGAQPQLQAARTIAEQIDHRTILQEIDAAW